MSKPKHTPGLWKYIARDNGVNAIRPDGTMPCIAIPQSSISGLTIEERTANGYLIAAAPDLLEAAKAVLRWVPENVERLDGQPSSRDRLIAAISKAEGANQ